MNRKMIYALLPVVALTSYAFAKWQLSVPDIEGYQKSLFRGFDDLERMDAYVVADNGDKLGDISKGYDRDSLGSTMGKGGTSASNGLFNPYSKYGDKYSPTSAFNDMASKPPMVVVKRNGEIYNVGLLTTNKYAHTRGQRINPYLLKAWLESK